MKDMKNDSGIRKTFAQFNIQSIILSVLMTLSLVTVTVMGFLLYHRFKLASDKSAVANTEMTVESTIDRLNSSLLDLRQISDAANYNIVQEYDISSQEFTRQFSMLYETNTDKIQSLALYGDDGMLIESEPVATVKDNVKVADQKWYQDARSEIENIHFSTPHVQNLFDDGTFRYHRVVSLSRSVDINDGSTSGSGVLLVDMKYSVLEDMLERINETSSGIYYYLCSRDGEIIYHPRWTEINRGLFKEKNNKAASYEDGIYEMKTDGQKENVVVGSVAYTGWKLIGVVPESVQETSINKFRYYIITTILILVMMLLQVNRFISRKISRPIRELDESVKAYEAGAMPDIYIGGSAEIRHLGYSVQKSYEQIETLMKEIIQQQTERRKSELDALQSQINPHFLYNALNTISYVCRENPNRARELILTLSSYYRQTLENDRYMLSLHTELYHVNSYLELEKARFEEKLSVEIHVDENLDCMVPSFILQPLVENAVRYGADKSGSRFVSIRAVRRGGLAEISVSDHGPGIPPTVLENLQSGAGNEGVGLENVHRRLKSIYGEENGLQAVNTPEGACVFFTVPAEGLPKYDAV